ncbi:FAD-binding oxidoreductase [Aspergillus stella-maris]|uniref:FAD-binding oxidoreductase n=1 Tax=Aspergillus stella-maris TaxID=1810926 RepID=UPI003CCE3B52
MDTLPSFASQNPSTELIIPSSPSYNTHRTIFVSPSVRPSAILRPSSILDVSKCVSFLTSHNIPFTIRVGGHDMHGRSMNNDSVTLDLRRLNNIIIEKESMTAKVGGGILASDLIEELQKEDLITPCGTVDAVGYVGWAMYGGYGLYSSLFGLGVDQIVGAKIVDARGEVVEVKAGDELLKGIRGAGGAFGVVVEATVRVYEMSQILAGAIMFQSSDLPTAIHEYNKGYRALVDEGLPPCLGLMQAVVPLPSPTLAVFFSWNSSDHIEGQEWLDKISSLAPVMVNTVGPITPLAFMAEVSKFVPKSTQGRMYTISLREITDEVAAVIADFTARIPSDPHLLFDIHQLRKESPSAHPNADSVFIAREPHYVVEICTIVANDENLEDALTWGREFQDALKKTEAANILPASYLSFLPREEIEPEKIFGSNLQFLKELKWKVDGGNVFKAAISYL